MQDLIAGQIDFIVSSAGDSTELVRSGSTFTGSVSPDGINWTVVGTDSIPMAASVYIGLAVTAHNNAALCTATLDSAARTTSSG